jgi:hypothetical protein
MLRHRHRLAPIVMVALLVVVICGAPLGHAEAQTATCSIAKLGPQPVSALLVDFTVVPAAGVDVPPPARAVVGSAGGPGPILVSALPDTDRAPRAPPSL